MAHAIYTLERYSYDFDLGAGRPRLLQLWTATALIADIHFVPDGQPHRPLQLQPGLTGAVITCPVSLAQGLIDLLRNEKPIRLYLDDTPAPGLAYLGSTFEPVGEEE